MRDQVYKVPYRNYHGWRLVKITGVYREPNRTTRVGVVTVNEPHDSFSVFDFQLEPVEVELVHAPYHGMVWRINESASDDAEALTQNSPALADI